MIPMFLQSQNTTLIFISSGLRSSVIVYALYNTTDETGTSFKFSSLHCCAKDD